MLDAKGETLVETFFMTATAGSSDPDRYITADTIVQTLRWPAERGRGARVDVTLSYHDGSGVLKSHSFSIPAR